MPLSAELVDREPRTDEEHREKLAALLEQARETVAALDEIRVTCPCGHRPPLTLAYRCYHCGLYLCRRCSERHFGPPPAIRGQRTA